MTMQAELDAITSHRGPDPRPRIRRTVGLVTALLVSVSGFTLATATPSMAVEGSVRCDMKGNVSFNPPVFVAPAQTTADFTGSRHECIDDAGTVVNAKFDATISGTMSCFKSPTGTSGKATISWGRPDGTFSTSTADVVLTGSDFNQGQLDGTVTSGYRVGENLHADVSVDLIDAAFKCVTGGVRSGTFTGSFTIG